MTAELNIQRILANIDPGELIRLTAALVRINSVWDPAAGSSEAPAADFVARWAEEQGFRVETDEVAPGRPNVIVTWGDDPGERNLMFEGHTDVVTPGDRSAWRYDPFGAEIVGRRMYGRGTNDTKGNLAAMLIAMAAIRRAGIKLRGQIVGGVLCDEEDAMLGVLDFIERGRADLITGAIICEPQDGMICTSQKGAVRARYTLTGRMSHGAMPLAGLNTAPALAHLINGLHRLELDAVNTIGQDRHLGWPSFTPTVIQAPAVGPAQLNVMPGESQLLVDVRTIPGQSHDDIREALKRLANEASDQSAAAYRDYNAKLGIEREPRIQIEVEFLTDRPCTLTAADDPVIAAAYWATREISRIEPVYGGVPGATDGTFLWHLKDIPIVTMGAGERHVAHQADEWVDLEQLAETARIYALAAYHYLGMDAA